MAGDKRELILDLLARDKSGPATKSFGKNLDEAATKAEKASKSTDKFGKSTETASDKADELAAQAKQTGDRIAKMDREIFLATAELKTLAKAFADTDDAAERIDLGKAIRRGEKDIRALTKNKGLLLLPDPEPASKSFFSKLGGLLNSGGNAIATAAGSKPGMVIGGVLGAAAAPVLVTALGSALSAGAGAGVLGAGVALALKGDPALAKAGSDIGKRFVKNLTAETKSLKTPILQAFGILEDAGERATKKLGQTFDALGPSIVPLTRDVVQAAERILDSVTGMAEKSGPALGGMGDSARLLADGVGDALDKISDGSPEAAENLVLLAGVTADLVRQTGNFLGTLNELSGNEWVTGPLLPLLRDKYQDAADKSDTLKGSSAALAETMTAAAAAATAQKTAMTELNTELRAQTDPVFGLLNAHDNLATAQDKAKEAVKDHGRKSKEARTALRELATAALDVQGRAAELGSTFNGKLTPELKAVLREAGLTEPQIKDLAREFQNARDKGKQFDGVYKATLKADTKKAVSDIRAAQRIVNSLDGRTIDIAMKVTGVTNVSKARAAIAKQYQARAAGGPITKNTPYWVGENGPELIFPSHDGRVLSAAASRGAQARTALNNTTLAAGSGAGQKLRLELVGQSEIVTMFRMLIRTANLLEA